MLLRGFAGHIPAVRPDHGGRLELKLQDASDSTARYTLTVYTPDSERSAPASIDVASEETELGAFSDGPPPAWLEAFARTLLRSVLRTKKSEGDWPRRLTRWRPEPKD